MTNPSDSPTTPGNIPREFREAAPGSFIYEIPEALPAEICEAMILRFEQNPDQQYRGRISQRAELEESIKRSTDLRISGRENWRDIDDLLQKSLSDALGQLSSIHPYFKTNRLRDIGYNLQRTEPGEYYHWHSDSGPGDFTKRQLVAIWYLNENTFLGGTTDFYFQKLSIVAEQGKLVLFPPFWTHIHRGKTVEKSNKYIATTWVCVD